eukprot:scaffold294182_cov33-Tisochrysis_lutea.AAC.3
MGKNARFTALLCSRPLSIFCRHLFDVHNICEISARGLHEAGVVSQPILLMRSRVAIGVVLDARAADWWHTGRPHILPTARAVYREAGIYSHQLSCGFESKQHYSSLCPCPLAPRRRQSRVRKVVRALQRTSKAAHSQKAPLLGLCRFAECDLEPELYARALALPTLGPASSLCSTRVSHPLCRCRCSCPPFHMVHRYPEQAKMDRPLWHPTG